MQVLSAATTAMSRLQEGLVEEDGGAMQNM